MLIYDVLRTIDSFIDTAKPRSTCDGNRPTGCRRTFGLVSSPDSSAVRDCLATAAGSVLQLFVPLIPSLRLL